MRQNQCYGKILLNTTSVIIVKMADHDGNHRCLIEKNVPIALIFPNKWQDGAKSLGMETTSCLWHNQQSSLLHIHFWNKKERSTMNQVSKTCNMLLKLISNLINLNWFLPITLAINDLASDLIQVIGSFKKFTKFFS